jgi:hypothetical protein
MLARYHDHALHITLDNAYHGLAGFFSMSDHRRIGGCGEPYNLDVSSRYLGLCPSTVPTPPT